MSEEISPIDKVERVDKRRAPSEVLLVEPEHELHPVAESQALQKSVRKRTKVDGEARPPAKGARSKPPPPVFNPEGGVAITPPVTQPTLGVPHVSPVQHEVEKDVGDHSTVVHPSPEAPAPSAQEVTPEGQGASPPKPRGRRKTSPTTPSVQVVPDAPVPIVSEAFNPAASAEGPEVDHKTLFVTEKGEVGAPNIEEGPSEGEHPVPSLPVTEDHPPLPEHISQDEKTEALVAPVLPPLDYLSVPSAIFDLYAYMINSLAISHKQGRTELTFTLASPCFAKSVLYGVQVRIDQSDRSSELTIALHGSTTAMDFVAKHQEKLFRLFEKNKEHFTIKSFTLTPQSEDIAYEDT